jgi:hypothetical protein
MHFYTLVYFKQKSGLLTSGVNHFFMRTTAKTQRLAIDRGIAKSMKEYKQGKAFGPFGTHKEFISSLHKMTGKLPSKKAKIQYDEAFL